MKTRVKAATADAAVDGAREIKETAKANILARFENKTFDLYNSMYSDDIATPVGPDAFSARAFPRGGPPPGTVYGRIQELGGTIYAQGGGRNDLLWFEGFRWDSKANGYTFGLISVPEVTLEGRFYLRDAVLADLTELRETAARHWRVALEE
jgi:hypothetical protein